MDIVARQLEKNAGAGDLIVVNPWFLGVSFNCGYWSRLYAKVGHDPDHFRASFIAMI